MINFQSNLVILIVFASYKYSMNEIKIECQIYVIMDIKIEYIYHNYCFNYYYYCFIDNDLNHMVQIAFILSIYQYHLIIFFNLTYHCYQHYEGVQIITFLLKIIVVMKIFVIYVYSFIYFIFIFHYNPNFQLFLYLFFYLYLH